MKTSEKNSARINFLPAPTWNFINMNYSEVDDICFKKSAECHIALPEGIEYKEKKSFSLEEKTALGNDFSILTKDNLKSIDSYTVKKNKRIDECARLLYLFKDENSINGVEIVSEEGSKSVFVIDLLSKDINKDKKDLNDISLSLKYLVKKDAELTIVTIQRVSDSARLFNDIGGAVKENGKVKLYQLLLSGKETYMGCAASLPERKGDFSARIGYLLKDDDILDMNYVSDHTGKKTNCDIKVSGVLRDRSKKLFRGTIDFHKGCAGSTGSEIEDVLLMDKDVRNKTIPLILCDEEDVEGAHGASIGRVDESVLFYLKSRGIPEDKIYEMMAEAKIEAVLSDLPDEFSVCSVKRFLNS